MGHKVNPTVFRIGQTTDWKSRWFSKRNYNIFLGQDLTIREWLQKKLAKAGLDRVEIERSANQINAIIFTARPGLIIGRGGAGVEALRKELQKKLNKISRGQQTPEVKLSIEEIRDANSRAAVVAGMIAEQIEKRMPYRRVLKQFLEKISQTKGVQGVKIVLGGRLDGAEISRREWLYKGKIPLQTLRADIDYATATAFTTYGTVGIKVWIYKGEIFEKKKEEPKDGTAK